MQSLVLTDMDIIGIFLQNTFTGRQFVCKIQERVFNLQTGLFCNERGMDNV